MSQDDPTQEQVVQGLARAGLPPDKNLPEGPEWFSDYGGAALADAYRAGWRDGAADQSEADGATPGVPQQVRGWIWDRLSEAQRDGLDREDFERWCDGYGWQHLRPNTKTLPDDVRAELRRLPAFMTPAIEDLARLLPAPSQEDRKDAPPMHGALEVQVFVPSEKATTSLALLSSEGKNVRTAHLSQAVLDGDGTWVPISAIEPGVSEKSTGDKLDPGDLFTDYLQFIRSSHEPSEASQELVASGLAEFFRWRYGMRPTIGSE